MSEIENRTTIDKINETKSRFFENLNKINKPVARQRLKDKTKYPHYHGPKVLVRNWVKYTYQILSLGMHSKISTY